MAAPSAPGAAPAPYCEGCKHLHHQHDKCPTCGHHGHIVGMPGPDDPRPPAPHFYTTQFDISTEPQHTTMGYFALIKIMRTRTYVNELKAISGDADYDVYDAQSRHVLGLIGDAPVAYARWRAVTAASVDPPPPGTAPDGRAVLVIDRLLVLKDYRGRGFAKNVLQVALADAAQHIVRLSVPASRVCVFVPSRSEFAAVAKVCMGVGLGAICERPCDPTGLWPPSQKVYEFALGADVLINYVRAQMQAAAQAAGAAAAAQPPPPGAAAPQPVAR